MNKTILALLLVLPLASAHAADTKSRPNILFIIADDASRHFGQSYGCNWIKTPNIDRLGREGLVFDNAYTPTSKCAPSRAAIITGRNPWQLEEAANHQPYFPIKYIAFTEALAKSGILCGGAGKTWGPGEAKNADGAARNFGLRPTKAKGGDQTTAFAEFLKSRPAGANVPFFFWFGSHFPHRPYKLDAGLAAGKKPADITHVPAYWPDNETVRRDMLDYATEVEAFDAQVGALIKTLDESPEANNTLVIVTSDNGMPFPRVKGHTIDDAHHLPLIARWPAGIARPGRRVPDLVSFIDFAPTFLELLAVDGPAAGMSPITGRSFTDLLAGKPAAPRPFLIIGRERNDVLCRPGSPAGLSYPVRALRQGNLLYIHNFAPDRWPCGNPDVGFRDTDAGPTKKLIEDSGDKDRFWQFAFGKRPAAQLFDLSTDPDCINDLSQDPAQAPQVTKMRDTLLTELKTQSDPRVLGQGDLFDNYLSPRTKTVQIKPR